MKSKIQSELIRIERERGVRVLYAIESGSRAWGIESTNSDYDVRFIYRHEPDWYLSVERGRDVIENAINDDLDISGWDLRKALGLLRKSNPPLLEWLKSPIVYYEDADFIAGFRALADKYYGPGRCFLHYLHMAEGNFHRYLQGELISLKKYLYVLRPVCACRWIERGLGAPPIKFCELVGKTIAEPDLVIAIEELVRRKRAGEEMDHAPRVPVISDFLESELARLNDLVPDKIAEPPVEGLNTFFRHTLLKNS